MSKTKAQTKVIGRSISTRPSETSSSDATRVTPRGASLFDLPVHLYHDARCRVCNHPDRLGIERKIAEGIHFTVLATYLGENHPAGAPLPAPSVKSLSNHLSQHMPSSFALELAMAKDASEAAGVDIQETSSVVSPFSVLATIVRQGFAAMAEGRMRAKASDVIKAAELMHRISVESGGDVSKEAALAEALESVISLSLDYIAPEDLAAYAAELDMRNPIVRAMRTQGAAASSQAQVMELEAWENDDIEDEEDEDEADEP